MTVFCKSFLVLLVWPYYAASVSKNAVYGISRKIRSRTKNITIWEFKKMHYGILINVDVGQSEWYHNVVMLYLAGYGPWVGLHITESLPADSIAPRLSARERSTNTL